MATEQLHSTGEKTHQLKVVLLGDGTTGKTSLATRISQNSFTKTYDQTLGVDFFMRRIDLPGDVQVTLQVWDIGGQTVGGQMLENYIYGANAVLFIYDITNYSSFENLEDWLRETLKVCTKADKPFPHLALVANKIDLEHMRTVKRERHAEFARKHKMSSHLLSAKTDDMVYKCFLRVAADVLKIKLTARDIDSSQKVIRADIVPHHVPKPMQTTNTTGSGQRTTRSVFCSLQ